MHRASAGALGDERLASAAAALLSALLHALLLALAMSSPPITMATPEGAASGSRVQVVMIGETPESTQPEELPVPVPAVQPPTPRPPDPAQPSPPLADVQPTPVTRADHAMPRQAAPPPAGGAPPATGRRSHVWGQPPGMLPEDHAPVNAGPTPSQAIDQGRRYNASSGEPNLEVGGYQVLYDVLSQSRLRAWRDAGMTELYLPLPGAREYMVCPLETALRRESGACRLLDPDDPEMADIGDAREVITMHRVYRRGELVWRGPRPYR